MTLTIEAVEPDVQEVEISAITRDVVVRAKGTNRETVEAYALEMANGAEFPPIVCYRDAKGTLHLSDGAHRIEAVTHNGGTTIRAEIRQGSKKDCLTHAVGSARSFGLRFTTADKRRAIEMMLAAFPKMSNLKLSQLIGVDDKTVAATRERLAKAAAGSEIPTREDDAGLTNPSELNPSDAVVARLAKQLEGVLKKWPAERRAELTERLLAAVTEPEAEAG